MFPSRALRTAVFSLIEATQVWRIVDSTAPRILLYHGVTKERQDGIFNYRGKFIDTDAFAQHVTWLQERYEIVPLANLVATRSGSRSTRAQIAITFDDGYRNNYTNAFPVLRDAGAPATFFITTDFVDRLMPLPVDRIESCIDRASVKTLRIGATTYNISSREQKVSTDMELRRRMKRLDRDSANSLLEELESSCASRLQDSLAESPYAPMNWDEIEEMESAGMTFAAHTCTHPILSMLTKEEAREEIRTSQEMLARHVRPLPIFAYPNGGTSDYNDDTVAELKDAGFTAALTTRPAFVSTTDTPFELPRLTMDGANDISRTRLILSGLYYRL